MPRAPAGDDRAPRVRRRWMPRVSAAVAGAAGGSRRRAPMLANAAAAGALHREIRRARGRRSAPAARDGPLRFFRRHPRARAARTGDPGALAGRRYLRGTRLDPGSALRAVREDVVFCCHPRGSGDPVAPARRRYLRCARLDPGSALQAVRDDVPARPCGPFGMTSEEGPPVADPHLASAHHCSVRSTRMPVWPPLTAMPASSSSGRPA